MSNYKLCNLDTYNHNFGSSVVPKPISESQVVGYLCSQNKQQPPRLYPQNTDTTQQDVCLFRAAMNFLRSRFGNRLTLSVFVSMFDKYRIIF